jgi:hypothetical protein
MKVFNSFQEMYDVNRSGMPRSLNTVTGNTPPNGTEIPQNMKGTYVPYAVKDGGYIRLAACDLDNPSKKPFFVTPMKFDSLEEAEAAANKIFANRNFPGNLAEPGKIVKLDLHGG